MSLPTKSKLTGWIKCRPYTRYIINRSAVSIAARQLAKLNSTTQHTGALRPLHWRTPDKTQTIALSFTALLMIRGHGVYLVGARTAYIRTVDSRHDHSLSVDLMRIHMNAYYGECLRNPKSGALSSQWQFIGWDTTLGIALKRNRCSK